MAKSGDELGVDLSELRAVGQLDLPYLARDYSTMNHLVASSADIDTVAFGYDTFGPDQVQAPWTGLRDRLQNLLGHSATRFEAAGAAILQIVDAYAATDEEAARMLRDEWRIHPPAAYSNSSDPPLGDAMPPPVLAP